MSKSSLALHNLRGFAMLMVVAVHSAMAYVATNPALQPRYDPPPLISDAIARLPSISSVHPNTSI